MKTLDDEALTEIVIAIDWGIQWMNWAWLLLHPDDQRRQREDWSRLFRAREKLASYDSIPEYGHK